MAITRWNPYKELQGIQDKMNRLWDNTFGEESGTLRTGEWYPAVDIYEDGENVVLKAELPGMEKSDIDVSVENNVLTLKGERKQEKEIRESDYHRVERVYGTFSRSFSLPSTVEPSKIKANYQNGILEVSLPKSSAAKPRKIEIKD